jgi:AhpD family alkylhydroperoxidase
MARIPPVDPGEPGFEIDDFWTDTAELLGRVPNFIRTVAQSPAAARWLVPFIATMHRGNSGTVLDVRIKNLVVLRTSLLNECDYCVGHNETLGRWLGLTDAEFESLTSPNIEDLVIFSERERAAIRWATLVTRNEAARDKVTYDGLRAFFSDVEIVEITLLCGMFNMINRFNDSLHVDPEPQSETDKITRSAEVTEERIAEFGRARATAVLDMSR